MGSDAGIAFGNAVARHPLLKEATAEMRPKILTQIWKMCQEGWQL